MFEIKFKDNLTAYDFPLHRVVVQHQDGSRCEFTNSFIELDKLVKNETYALDIIKIYTEHIGNHWFFIDDIEYFYTEQTNRPITFFQKFKKLIEYWKSFSL